jgi:hypothetical protein
MLPSEIRKYGEALAERSRPQQTPNLDALRSKLQSGKPCSAIERITADREAKEVLGKGLRELGLGP